MKMITGVLGIFFALMLSIGVAFGQGMSARTQLKADPAIQALGLSDAQLDAVLKELADIYRQHDERERLTRAHNIADEIMTADSDLRGRLLNERAAERAAEIAAE